MPSLSSSKCFSSCPAGATIPPGKHRRSSDDDYDSKNESTDVDDDNESDNDDESEDDESDDESEDDESEDESEDDESDEDTEKSDNDDEREGLRQEDKQPSALARSKGKKARTEKRPSHHSGVNGSDKVEKEKANFTPAPLWRKVMMMVERGGFCVGFSKAEIQKPNKRGGGGRALNFSVWLAESQNQNQNKNSVKETQ